MRHNPWTSIALAATSALLLAATTATAAPAQKKPAAKPALKTAPASTRQQARNAAKGLVLATETVESISGGQLDVAARVLTGQADCEFNQRVTVQALAGTPGYFTVSHLGQRYRMLPRETDTGAVRLEDPINGIVWLQIPAKSMLMNARRGQRMVDSCLHAEQRAATSAAAAAGSAQGIGIAVGVETPVASAQTMPGTTRIPVVQSDPPTPTVVVSPDPALAPPASSPVSAGG